MRRRKFITLLSSALVAAPPTLRAQQPRRPIVGLISGDVPEAQMAGPDPVFLPARAFVHRLRELGWTEDSSIVIERRSAEGRPDRARDVLAELFTRGVDVIMAGATDWLLDAVRKATQSIPTVAIFPTDPALAGLVSSLAQPGGNLTG